MGDCPSPGRLTVRFCSVKSAPAGISDAAVRLVRATAMLCRSLAAGAFSSDAAKSAQTGEELGLDPARVYPSWEAMADAEAALSADERIQAVSIVTPNHMHAPPAIAFLERGFHVVCDKPLTTSSALGGDIRAAVEKSGKVFCLTHNYPSSPMVREARELIRSGALGEVRKVYVEYLQGWLADKLEDTGLKQADWRTDPARSGPGGALGDIGTHAFHLMEHVTGRQVTRLLGDRRMFVDGRQVDDDAMVLFEMDNGATGSLFASQVCVGRENGLRLRVYGTDGGLEWEQEHPNDLKVWSKDGPMEVRRTSNGYLSDAAQSLGRTPAGHPEGYLEAFANVYRAAARHIREAEGLALGPNVGSPLEDDCPTVDEGLRGLVFLETVIASAEARQWMPLEG